MEVDAGYCTVHDGRTGLSGLGEGVLERLSTWEHVLGVCRGRDLFE